MSSDFYQEIELAASAARTATGNGDGFEGFGEANQAVFTLAVTAASGSNPTLDVTVQHSIDGGTTWFDLVSFAQKTGTGSELKSTGGAFVGDHLRAKWTIGGSNPSFPFKVNAAADDSPVAGPQGPQGAAGATGPAGATGATGPQGATGASGG